MSELSKKYNIPCETVNKMIKDGIISCSWTVYEEVYKQWTSGMTIGDIAFKHHMTERNVCYILKKFK